jgi:uncharacterized protein YegP (UPF0339 family)
LSKHPHVTRVRVYTDEGGEFRWSAFAANGEQVADSGEGYVNRADALAAAGSLFPEASIESVLGNRWASK